MRQPFSVLILDGESEFALFAAHCLARCPNVKIYALCESPWSPIRFSRYCRCITFKKSTKDDETILRTLANIVDENGIDVLLPTETKGISFAIDHREALSKFVSIPPLPDKKSFEIANDKWLLSRFLAENGIPGPKTVLVTEDILENRLQDLEFPVLLKPTCACGGEGIIPFDHSTVLRRYLETLDLEELRGRFILQPYLPGTVAGFNALSIQGEIIAMTMQRGIIPNTQKFAAAGAIEFIKDINLLEACSNLCSAFAWSGYANIDVLYDSRDQKVNILDLNARFWGSLRGSLAVGVNFPYLACLAALNIPFPRPDYDLGNYFHSKTALKLGLFKSFRKDPKRRVSVQETGLTFLLLDPLGEMIRAFQQEVFQ